MDLSPHMQDLTVSAIYQHYQDRCYEPPRKYLGASIIGKDCKRALWMDFRQVTNVCHDGRLYRLFETGHLAEPRFIANLQAVGVTVYAHDEHGNQWGVSFCGGHFRGHADGVAIGIKGAQKTWHLLEFKTHSDKSYKELITKGVQDAKPMHYAQMQVYMHGLNLTRAYYLAVNKNTDALYGERVHYDKEVAEALIERAYSVIHAPEPPSPISNNPAWYQCKMCEYHRFCHASGCRDFGILPDVNCRTCIHGTPTQDGQWQCDRTSSPIIIDTDKPCDKHRYIPHILPDYELLRADSDKVFYRCGDETYVNDDNGFKSCTN